jgi:S-adenosylmethionine-diacylglycerol 3-amino-3-carboxypropyl transferase
VNMPAPSASTDGLRSIVQERPVFSRIVYSQCWEDPVVAAEGLRLGPSDDLLCLTSAGDNVMALSLSRPKSITAIDFSAAQNALLELKLAALNKLGWYDYVAFLGARPAFDRVSTYRDKLRGELRDEVREYFDTQERELARGIIHAGRFQRYLSIFRTAVLPLVHGRHVVEEMMTIGDHAAREEYYRRVWDNRRWRALFTVFFGRAVMARLGRDPEFFKFVERKDVGATFLERCRRAMVESSPIDNHFLQYAMLGRYPDLERGPLYLRESNFETLRKTTANIKIVRGDLEGHLGTLEPGALSALYLSDLFEWVSPEHHEAMLRAIARATRRGGRMVYWNLLVPRKRPDALASLIATHDDEARALHARDLAFVYGSFHVESIL